MQRSGLRHLSTHYIFRLKVSHVHVVTVIILVHNYLMGFPKITFKIIVNGESIKSKRVTVILS